jgi:hypothetical protein
MASSLFPITVDSYYPEKSKGESVPDRQLKVLSKSPAVALKENLNSRAFFSNNQTYLSTGIKGLNPLLQGGIPRGKLVEVTGEMSSGRTGLILSILANATAESELVAYVDTFDSFDPRFAQKAGIDLERMLWIRCKQPWESKAYSLEKSFKVLDILSQAGGFGIVVLDTAPATNTYPGQLKRPPLHAWFRLQRAIKATPTTLLVLSRFRLTGSAASLALSLDRKKSCWYPRKYESFEHRSKKLELPNTCHSHLKISRVENRFEGLESNTHLLRGKTHGSVTVHCHF